MMKNVKQQAGYIIIGGFFSQFVSALKIHCSEACKGLLDKLGGYKLEPRGLVEMKVNIYLLYKDKVLQSSTREKKTLVWISVINSKGLSIVKLYMSKKSY